MIQANSIAVVFGTIFVCILPPASCAESAHEIYARRVLPLLESKDKSSCTECHLRGVELKDFLSTDPAKTFSELRGRGWIDTREPEKSKLLAFISRAPEAGDPLLEKVRTAESSALREWIIAAVADPLLLEQSLPKNTDLDLPLEFIRHARQDRVSASFADAVWSQLGRCVNCHSPDRNSKQVKEHGEQMSWIVPGNPYATLRLLTDRKLIDLDKPEESELRTKPLVLVEHGGGPKFPLGSDTDSRWTAFLIDYAKTVRLEGYGPGDAFPKLPLRHSWLSELQIKLTDLPDQFDGELMTVTLHRMLSDGRVEDEPVAKGQSTANPKQNVWQNALTVFLAVEPRSGMQQFSEPIGIAAAIPKGKYTLKVTADAPNSPAQKILARYIFDAPWPPGYQPPKTLSWKDRQ